MGWASALRISRLLPCAAIVAATTLLSGCLFVPVSPPRGLLYNNQKAPLFQGQRPGSKTGKASNHNIMFLVGWGDSSLDTAMKNGDIRELRHTDYQFVNVGLGIYQRYTTIARGE